MSKRRRFAACMFLLVASMGQAPFQCASDIDPNKKSYEDPGDALYGLAQHFKAQGDRDAQISTLRFLIERYPASRFAHAAKLDLEAIGEAQTQGNP